MKTYEATATATLDREAWERLRVAIAPVRAQPLAELHAEGRCSILLRVTGGGEGAIEVEDPRCTFGAEACARMPACKRSGASSGCRCRRRRSAPTARSRARTKSPFMVTLSGRGDAPRLLDVLVNGNAWERPRAAEIAGELLPTETIVPVLLELLNDESAVVREGATYGLLHHEARWAQFPRVRERLAELAASDENAGMRMVAAAALETEGA